MALRVTAVVKPQFLAPDARFILRENWRGYWGWAEDVLPTTLVELVEGVGELAEIPLVERCIVPPRLREEDDSAFLARVNQALTGANLRPMAILDSGENGFRIVALEGFFRNAVLAEMIFWVRIVGKRQWLRFVIETHTLGADHTSCVALPLVEHQGRSWVGLSQEPRFALFGDQDFMLGDWLDSICRNGWLRGVPRAFAQSNAQPSILDGVLGKTPVIGLRQPVSVGLASDVRSVVGRKIGAVVQKKSIDDLGEGPWFSFQDIIHLHRVAENSGRSNMVPEYFVVRMNYLGEGKNFHQVIQKRFGPRGMRFTWHPFEPLIGDDGIEECRKIGLVDAHSEVALFALQRSRKRLVNV